MTRYKYTKELLEPVVKDSYSVMEVMRKLDVRMAGGNHSHISNTISKFGIDTGHFTRQAHNKGKPSLTKLDSSEILVNNRRPSGLKEKTHVLRRAMIEAGVENACSSCGISDTWNGLPITIEIDHIDGNNLNNVLTNLRFLCPNCHSQQSNTNMPHKYRGRT